MENFSVSKPVLPDKAEPVFDTRISLGSYLTTFVALTLHTNSAVSVLALSQAALSQACSLGRILMLAMTGLDKCCRSQVRTGDVSKTA